MKGKTRTAARCVAAVMCASTILPAHAILVFDIPNFFVNKANFHQLIEINNQLRNKTDPGTINYNTLWIDKSTRNIDKSTTRISKTTQNIYNVTRQYNEWNYDIDMDFTWIINNDGGEIIPIPGVVEDKLKLVANWDDVDTFNGKFKTAEEYGSLPDGGFTPAATFEGSRARKAANDALVQAIGSEKNAFDAELAGLKKIAEVGEKAQGHGHQLQVANALAVSQINQLMKLRSMMLVSEASRAVEAHAEADKEARAIAVGNHLRKGLDGAVNQSLTPLPKY